MMPKIATVTVNHPSGLVSEWNDERTFLIDDLGKVIAEIEKDYHWTSLVVTIVKDREE